MLFVHLLCNSTKQEVRVVLEPC